MNQLKWMQYKNPKPFHECAKGICYFCHDEGKCYVSNNYYVSISSPLVICRNAYKELNQVKEHVILTEHILSLYLINDVKRLIQSLIYQFSNCIN